MRFFSVLKNRNLRLLTAADAVSVLGDQMGWIAILWFATVTTRNPAIVGAMGLVFGLPSVALGAVVGNMLDRMPQKPVIAAANVVLGLLFVAIPLLHRLGLLPIAVLILLVFAAGCLIPFVNVGWMAIIPTVVPEAELGAANSAAETVWHGASLIGPVIGGWLIAQFGSQLAILVDGVTYWLAAWFVLRLRIPGAKPVSAGARANRPLKRFWTETWEGFQLLYQLKPVWWITIGAIAFNLAYGQLEVSLPLLMHVELHTGAQVLGLAWTLYFLASLAGTAICGWLTTKGKPGIWMAVMAAGWGLCFTPLLLHASLLTVLCSMACAGLLFAGYPPLARTTVQKLVPRAYQGRVLGVRSSVMGAGLPAGAAIGGWGGSFLSSAQVISLTGFFVFCVGILLFFVRSFRRIEG